jgi:hypothetical protein
MKCQSIPCIAAVCGLALCYGTVALRAIDRVQMDMAKIEAITGLKGVLNQTEDTFKVSKPRELN